MVTPLSQLSRADRPPRIAMVAPPWYEVPPRGGYGGIEAIDEIHDHTNAGALTAHQRSAPTVVTAHGPVDGELGDYHAHLGDAVALVAISEAQRRSRSELSWIATVPNSVRVEDFPYRDQPGRRVLWLARFAQEKGPELAITACREAGLPLALAGKCSEPAEQAYLEDVVCPLLGPDVELILNADRDRTPEAARRRPLPAAAHLLGRAVRHGDDRGDGLRYPGGRAGARCRAGGGQGRRDGADLRRSGRATGRAARRHGDLPGGVPGPRPQVVLRGGAATPAS